MRPIWNGSISFGLVNIPVRLYSGSNPRQGLELDMLHKDDHSPIRYARICRKDGEEIPWGDIVKGYEYRDGDYIVLTQADFDKADVHQSRTIDVQQFVDETDIDIRYFEKPYYLEPDTGADKAYALLREALKKSKKSALVTYALRERAYLGVINPIGNALVLTQMRFPTDLREATGLDFPASNVVDEKEIKMALDLIKQETKPFIAEDFHDTYTEKIEDIIAEKAKGHKLKAHGKAPQKTEAKDLMAALKASLKQK